MTDVDATEKPSLRKIYRRQRAHDKAQQTTSSKVITGLFPVLLVVGIALHGKANQIFTIVCGALAVVLFVAFFVLLRHNRVERAGSPPTA